MKTFVVIALILAVCTATTVRSSAELALEERIHELKKTGWGKVAVGLMELQLQTGGPLSELVTAFKNLIMDLNFKLGSEQEEYRWAKAEHFEYNNFLEDAITSARFRFSVATAHLENTLYPQRAQLEHLIAVDEQLVEDTNAAIAKATRERNEAQEFYERSVEEHDLAMDAVRECQELIAGLQAGSSFVEIKKAQSHLKKLTNRLKGFNPLAHLAKALVEMAQDFANKSATQKVADLLTDLLGNLVGSRLEADQKNLEEIAAYEAFLAVCYTTIAQAEVRIANNEAELAVVNANIAHQEDLRDIAQNDWTTSQADKDAEDARWAAAVAAYEDLIAELELELDAIDRVLELFATADVSDNMLDRMDW